MPEIPPPNDPMWQDRDKQIRSIVTDALQDQSERLNRFVTIPQAILTMAVSLAVLIGIVWGYVSSVQKQIADESARTTLLEYQAKQHQAQFTDTNARFDRIETKIDEIRSRLR